MAREDVPLLVEHFIRQFNVKMEKRINGVSKEVLNLFMQYDFHGNIRELENIVEYACVLCREPEITTAHLPKEFQAKVGALGKGAVQGKRSLQSSEAQFIREMLAKHGGHRAKAAHELGIHPSTLWRKMKKLGIE